MRNKDIAPQLLAPGLLAAAVCIRVVLDPWLGDSLSHPTIFICVLLTAWYVGTREAIINAVLGYIAIQLLVIDNPSSGINPAYLAPALGLYITLNVIIIVFVERLRGEHRALCSAEAAARTAALEMERQKELLAVTLRSIGDGVIVTDCNGDITFINAEAERITKWSSSEALGQPLKAVFNIINEHTRKPVESPVEKVLRVGTVVGLANHTVLIGRDGTETPIDDSGAPIRSSDGQIRGVVLVFRDFGDRKRAQEQVLRTSQMLRSVLDTVPVRVFWKDKDSVFLGCNRAFSHDAGVTSAQEIIGKTDFDLCWREHANLYRADDQLVIQRAEPKFNYEEPQSTPEGKRLWLRTSKIPLRDPAGQIIGVLGTYEDITELKRAEEALIAAKAAAEEANRAKDQFLAVLSHELRTPLTPVLATVQLMQRQERLDEDDLRTSLDIIRRNVELEARLIDDLLDLTRIVRGNVFLDRKPVEICSAIERVIEICKPDIEARRLNFAADIEQGRCSVEADMARLQQIFWNLLKNSIKFTPEGGQVGVLAYRRDGFVIVEVNDTGIGIDPDIMARLFNAFEQGEGSVSRQFGGLGLGLAISKRLVELHGGEITAQSGGTGKGATFKVALPISFEAALPEPAVVTASLTGKIGRRILLVEDHDDTLLMMRKVLEAAGYYVRTAADVAQAIAALETSEFDLLISDLGLPDRSGIDLMRELRRNGNLVKSIALTGFGHEGDIERSKEAGFDLHLTKPVSLEKLIEAVEKISGKR